MNFLFSFLEVYNDDDDDNNSNSNSDSDEKYTANNSSMSLYLKDLEITLHSHYCYPSFF